MKNGSQSRDPKRLTFDEKVRRAAVLATRAVHKLYADAGRKMPIWKDGRVVYVAPTGH